MARMTIELPIPLPTWNRILAMNQWDRMRLRDLIHHFVSLSITHGSDWPTWTDYQGKRQSTDLLRLEYFQMIRPNKSRRSTIDSLKGRKRRPSSKSKKSKPTNIEKPF